MSVRRGMSVCVGAVDHVCWRKPLLIKRCEASPKKHISGGVEFMFDTCSCRRHTWFPDFCVCQGSLLIPSSWLSSLD